MMQKFSQWIWKENIFSVTKHHTDTKLLSLSAGQDMVESIKGQDMKNDSIFLKNKAVDSSLDGRNADDCFGGN